MVLPIFTQKYMERKVNSFRCETWHFVCIVFWKLSNCNRMRYKSRGLWITMHQRRLGINIYICLDNGVASLVDVCCIVMQFHA